MNRVIKKTMFHTAMCLRWGHDRQALKFIEEMGELNLALKEQDRMHIIEELADVELTMPYVFHLLPNFHQERINSCGIVYPYESAYNFASMAVTSRIKQGNIKNLTQLLFEALTLLSISLSGIYLKHCITEREVDDWIKYKKRRTIKRAVTGGRL